LGIDEPPPCDWVGDGPFVMHRAGEIRHAIGGYAAGRFGWLLAQD